MKKKLYLMSLFGIILFLITSCKKEDPGYSFPILGFNFYLVNQSTGENLVSTVGEHSYHPGEVRFSVIYGKFLHFKN